MATKWIENGDAIPSFQRFGQYPHILMDHNLLGYQKKAQSFDIRSINESP